MAKDKQQMILVDNRQAGHRHIPASRHPRAVAEKHVDINLTPGINEIPAREWEEAKTLPVIAALLEEESLAEVEVKGKAISDLKGLSDKQAIKLVKDTNDHDLLEKWSNQPQSKAVAKAIADQLDELTKPAATEKA